jgi:hypothetical protein
MTTPFDPSAFLSTCSGRPGVYRMFDSEARLLYVGKAKNLKNRGTDLVASVIYIEFKRAAPVPRVRNSVVSWAKGQEP